MFIPLGSGYAGLGKDGVTFHNRNGGGKVYSGADYRHRAQPLAQQLYNGRLRL